MAEATVDWTGAFGRLVKRESLSREELAALYLQALSDPQGYQNVILTLFATLSTKGATEEELNGMGDAMNRCCTFRRIPELEDRVVTIAGTGGDTIKTVNVSSAAALVAAGAGALVGKFGARAVSSVSGAVDVMEAVGVNIHGSTEVVQRCLDEVGISFGAAADYYPWITWLEQTLRGPHGAAFAPVIVPTLRPSLMAAMINPFGPVRYMRGVVSPDTERVAHFMRARGYQRALVIYGRGPHEGLFLDEVSNVGETVITELRDQRLETYTVAPEDFGLKRATPDEILGGQTLSEQAQLLVNILKGREEGPRREIVLMNAAVLLRLADLIEDLPVGVEAAARSIDSGAALEKLRGLVERSGGDLGRLEGFVGRSM